MAKRPRPLDKLPDEVLSNILRFVRNVLPERNVACKSHTLDQKDLARCMRVNLRFNHLTAPHLYAAVRFSDHVSLALGLDPLDGDAECSLGDGQASDPDSNVSARKARTGPSAPSAPDARHGVSRRLTKVECLRNVRRLFIEDSAFLKTCTNRLLMTVFSGDNPPFGPKTSDHHEQQDMDLVRLFAGLLGERDAAFSLLCAHLERLVERDEMPRLDALSIGAFCHYNVSFDPWPISNKRAHEAVKATRTNYAPRLRRLVKHASKGVLCVDTSAVSHVNPEGLSAMVAETETETPYAAPRIVYHVHHITTSRSCGADLPLYPRLTIWSDSGTWQHPQSLDGIRKTILEWAQKMTHIRARPDASPASSGILGAAAPADIPQAGTKAAKALSIIVRVGLPPIRWIPASSDASPHPAPSTPSDISSLSEHDDEAGIDRWMRYWRIWADRTEKSSAAPIDVKVEALGGETVCGACGMTRAAPSEIPEGWQVDDGQMALFRKAVRAD